MQKQQVGKKKEDKIIFSSDDKIKYLFVYSIWLW
jgi:hypothetical protein